MISINKHYTPIWLAIFHTDRFNKFIQITLTSANPPPQHARSIHSNSARRTLNLSLSWLTFHIYTTVLTWRSLLCYSVASVRLSYCLSSVTRNVQCKIHTRRHILARRLPCHWGCHSKQFVCTTMLPPSNPPIWYTVLHFLKSSWRLLLPEARFLARNSPNTVRRPGSVRGPAPAGGAKALPRPYSHNKRATCKWKGGEG